MVRMKKMEVVCVSLNSEKNSVYPCKIDIDEIKLFETKAKYIVGFTTHVVDIKTSSTLT